MLEFLSPKALRFMKCDTQKLMFTSRLHQSILYASFIFVASLFVMMQFDLPDRWIIYLCLGKRSFCNHVGFLLSGIVLGGIHRDK